MQLVLYKNISSDNTINKTLTNGTVFNINLKRETDILNPDLFLVKLTGIDYSDFNYAEIVELKRFYFINSISSVNASLFKLECVTDVLETYKLNISEAEGTFRRLPDAGVYGGVVSNATGEFSEVTYDSPIELEKTENFVISVRVNK